MSQSNGADHEADRHDDAVTRLDSDDRLTRLAQPAAGPQPRRKSWEAGHIVGPYTIHRRLGAGGMGEVYEAEQQGTGRRLALKVLTRSLDNPEAAARFMREGRLAASVSHPNSVYVYGAHELDGLPMIAMELVPGGTLQEVVDTGGPMAPPQAVEATLQVIAGLESAHATGVLHRDVKPSNCFMDSSGTVKVGDYGLSMSTSVTGQSTQLTMQGTFLGTPAFASPEQVSGNDIDVRSDIYSVGATLYFLLTGRTPFAHASVMQVFAAILREDPASPRVHNPAVPEKLAEVVLRCLKKDPAARYASYADLREALVPFGASRAETAPVRLRFIAYLLDALVLAPVGVIAGFIGGFSGSTSRIPSFWAVIASTIVSLLYYGLCEGRWGAAVGKRVCGLRVVGRDGVPPGLARAFARTAVFMAITNLDNVSIYWRFGFNPDVPASEAAMLLPIKLLLSVLVWVAARKRNGYRGLHDWATGTRVIRPAADRRAVAPRPTSAALPGSVPLHDRIGDYACDARLWAFNGEELIAAHDEALRRPVWIHRVPPGTPALSHARQDLARAARLRVLSSVRGEHESFDVYEAVPGAPLTCDQPWNVVRPWLTDLSAELSAASSDGTIPATLSIDHVWVSATGGIRLLDFPAVRSTTADTSEAVADFAGAQALLGRVADHVLAGPRTAGANSVPLSGRTIVDKLRRRAFATADDLRASLAEASRSLDSVSRARRLATMALAAGLPLLTTLGVVIAMYWNYSLRNNPDLDMFGSLLNRLERMESQAVKADDVRQRDALRIYLGDRFSAMIDSPATWTGFSRALLVQRRQVATRARQAAQGATADIRAQATKDVAPIVDELTRNAANRKPFWVEFLRVFGIANCIVLAVTGGVATVLAFFLRAPAALRLVGLSVMTSEGAPATRMRAALRGIICWSPVFLGTVALIVLSRLMPGSDTLQAILCLAGLAIFLVGVVWTVVVPGRGPHDILARTVVVPS